MQLFSTMSFFMNLMIGKLGLDAMGSEDTALPGAGPPLISNAPMARSGCVAAQSSKEAWVGQRQYRVDERSHGNQKLPARTTLKHTSRLNK